MLLSVTAALGGLVSRSLTYQSRLTLVHAFVTSRIDSCCYLLAGLPLGTLARLDRVLRSAARLVGGGLSKFSSITAYMRDVLHWLPISQRIQYRITAMVSRCVLRFTPSYLCDLCCPASVLAWRRPSGAAFYFALSGTFRYYALRGLFGCGGSISMERSPL